MGGSVSTCLQGQVDVLQPLHYLICLERVLFGDSKIPRVYLQWTYFLRPLRERPQDSPCPTAALVTVMPTDCSIYEPKLMKWATGARCRSLSCSAQGLRSWSSGVDHDQESEVAVATCCH